MVLGMMSIAMAESEYSITVKNTNTSMSINGKDYKAYKVFDMTLGGETTTGEGSDATTTYSAYAYSIKNTDWAWSTLIAGADTDEDTGVITTKYGIVLTPSAADPTVYTVNGDDMDPDDARAFADALQPVLPTTADGSGTGANEEALIELTKPGYYAIYGVVIPTDPKANPAEEVVAAVGLDSTDKNITVAPKASVPTLDKKITGVTEDGDVLDEDGKAAVAKVGAKVSYELDSVVPDLTGYSNYTFIIGDTISSGLTYDNTSLSSLKVKINGTDLPASTTSEGEGGTEVTTSNYTLSVSGQTFTLTIPYATLKKYTAGDTIVVTYDAIVNKNALTTDYENNTAKLTYSRNPYDNTTNETPEKKTYVIDLNIDVDKIGNNESTKKLAGAEFKLYKTSAGTDTYTQVTEYVAGTAYYTKDGENYVAATVNDADAFAAGTFYTKSTSAGAKTYYKWADDKVTWVSSQSDGDTFTTDNTGKLTQQVRGLDKGTYYLEETKAPAGYNVLSAPVEVVISVNEADDKVTYTATADGQTASVTNGAVDLKSAQTNAQPVAVATINNESGTELPSTGGIGTTMFYIIGAALVLGAGIVLVTKRKMAVK